MTLRVTGFLMILTSQGKVAVISLLHHHCPIFLAKPARRPSRLLEHTEQLPGAAVSPALSNPSRGHEPVNLALRGVCFKPVLWWWFFFPPKYALKTGKLPQGKDGAQFSLPVWEHIIAGW